MIEALRAKYILLSMRLYMWFTELWYNHIVNQNHIYLNNLSPEVKRDVKGRIDNERWYH